MADVHVHGVNKSGQAFGLTLDEDSDFLQHLKTQVKRDELESVKVEPIKKAAARKPAQSED